MTFKITETTIGTAVASSGTITFSYPSNTSAGTYATYGHKLWVDKHQKLYSSPSDFTVSFGASNITVTYNGSTSIPVGAEVKLQANIEGDDQNKLNIDISENEVKRTNLASLIKITLGSPDVADPNGICESQTINTTGSLNGALVTGGAAVLDVPRNIVAAWTTTATITITGTDEYGNTIVETSASGTSHTGKKAFKTVTSVESSTSITSATVGTGDVLGLPQFLENTSYVIGVKEGTTYYDKSSKIVLNSDSPALSSASQVYAVNPIAGHITQVQAVTTTAITTGDSTITVKAPDGTVGTIVIASSGSAVGTVDTINALANTEVAAGETIEYENDATPGAGAASFSAVIEPGGILTAGVSTAGTATSGDNKGTYDPIAAMDGSTEVSLYMICLEPTYKGIAQYAG